MPLAILCCLVNVAAAETFGLFTYTDNGASITITGFPSNTVGAVEIPETISGKPVTVIGAEAFSGCMFLTDITIPNSVTSIERGAFNSCRGLTSISIGDSVRSIGGGESYGAFASCTSLSSIIIPNSVTSIERYAFYDCRSLNSINIPDSVTSLGDYAFSGCTNLNEVTIGSGVTRIGTWMFNGCFSLRRITIPNSVTSIGPSAFGDTSLDRITIPSSVTSIDGGAFGFCRSLKNVVFSGNPPLMGSGVFHNNASYFRIYYVLGSTGFTTPTWQGYPAFPGVASQFTSAAPAPTGKVGSTYSHTCTATGTPEVTFAVSSGALPDGLVLSDAGVISGAPTAVGVFSGTISASNGIPPDATQTFTIDTNEYRAVVANGSNGSVTGTGTYLLNATAALTATPSPGYIFTGWNGDATGTDNPLSVLMDSSKTIGATFSPDTNDSDDDGFTNYEEIVIHGTNPALPDTDGDNVKDPMDAFPLNPAETLDTDRDGTGDNADTDDDGDGYSDDDEVNIHGTNPKRADSDGDGLSDPAEIQTHLTNPNIADTDNDGLSDGAEVNTHGTNPKDGDSDDDGFLDGYEVFTGKLPLDPLNKPALVAEARTAIEFVFPAAIGKTYRIEDSTDLVTWGTVESGIVGAGGQVQRFYSILNTPKRYFRVEENAP